MVHAFPTVSAENAQPAQGSGVENTSPPPNNHPAGDEQPCKFCQKESDWPNPFPVYGKVHQLVCFQHRRLTPQGEKFLRSLPLKKYPGGAAGVSRAGKSAKLNEFVKYLWKFAKEAAGGATLPEQSEEFKVSAHPIPETKGLQVIAIPRCVDGNGQALPAMDGCYLVVDSEGTDLGATSDHQAILGMMTRFVTQLSCFEAGQFNYNSITSLGRLVASNMVINNQASAMVSWPHLSLVVNKYDLLPPQPDHATWIQDILRHNPDDEGHNLDRKTVRHTWLTPGKLDYLTIPVDFVLMNPGLASQLTGDALATVDGAAIAATTSWIRHVLSKSSLLTMQILAGSSTNTTSPVERQGMLAPVSGDDLVRYLSHLMGAYGTTRTFPVFGAMENVVQGICQVAKEAAVQKYSSEKGQSPNNLQPGLDEVDGARGTADDTTAIGMRDTVLGRHDTLMAACERSFGDATVTYSGLGASTDDVIAQALREARGALAVERARLREYWTHLRSIDPTQTTTETGIEDSPRWQKVHHTEEEQVWFHTVTHYFWAEYVHRWNRTRLRQVRRNGDVVYAPWERVGSPSEVLVYGPWHGGKP